MTTDRDHPLPPRVPPHSDLDEFYPDPKERARFVNQLFDFTATDYNRISSMLSFGTDRTHRRRALESVGVGPKTRLLDVATGTGLVLKAALELGVLPHRMIGLDPSMGMLEVNQVEYGVPLVRGLGERTPFASESFDVVTMGYALRHVEDLHALFSEFFRLLQRKGRLLILEVSRPRTPVGYHALRLYMDWIAPPIIRAVTGRRACGRLVEYYWATIAGCVPPETIVATLATSGFDEVHVKSLGGLLSEYSARKP